MSGYSPILELGDDPLTPREKVARIVDPWAFSIVANIQHTERAADDQGKALTKADAILTALASGSGDQLSGNPGILKSGDHAELARLAEAASGSDWQTYISGRPEYKNVTHYVEQNPPRDLPFIAEVQEERDAAFIAAANPATILALLAENAALRADNTEAERKLAEAVGVLRDLSSWFDGAAHNGVWIIRSGDLGADDAVCAARTFLSKEAERG